MGSGACPGSCLSDPQDFLSQYGRRGSTGAASGLVSPHPHLLLPGSSLACPRLILMAKEQAGPPQCKKRRCTYSSCPFPSPALGTVHDKDAAKGITHSWQLPAPPPHGFPCAVSIRSPLQTSPDELQAPSHGLRVMAWDPRLCSCGDGLPPPCTPHCCL